MEGEHLPRIQQHTSLQKVVAAVLQAGLAVTGRSEGGDGGHNGESDGSELDHFEELS